MNYRPEIDGLRAIAVLSVILFHSGIDCFKGGYIGVDVFFVISGYLITSILINDLKSNHFNLIVFYERRIRRIIPALFFMMLVSIFLSWILMFSHQYKDFSQSLIATSFFSSNILFWKESGYFDTSSELKPLLHTWSLSIEEQYYFIFPILLFCIWNYFKKKLIHIFLFLFLISFLIAEFNVYDNLSANFYLLPSRFWELLAGAIVSYLIYKNKNLDNNLLSTIGFILVILSLILLDDKSPHPGKYTFLAILGTSLIILYTSESGIVYRFLSNKILVGIGLISYSLYLWHFPFFSFFKIFHNSDLLSNDIIYLLICIFIVAYLSWRYIELPFRNKNFLTRRNIFFLFFISSSLFVSIGLLGHFKDGFPKKNSTYDNEYNLSVNKKINLPIFVLGDSHAKHLITGLSKYTNTTPIDFSGRGCIPYRDVDRYDSRFLPGDCVKKINSNLDKLTLINKKSVIIFSSMGPVYLDAKTFKGKDKARVTGLGVELVNKPNVKNHYEIFKISIKNTLDELLLNKNLLIFFAFDVPELGIDRGCQNNNKEINFFNLFNIKDNVKQINSSKCNVSKVEYEDRVLKYKKLINEILIDYPNVRIFDPSKYFCNYEICHGYIEGVGYLYKDFDHLSDNGSKYYANKFFSEYKFLFNE